MIKMIDFNEYLVTKTFEAMDLKIKEVELILSPRLLKILKEINHQIAEDLLERHVEGEREFKVTFVDLGSEAGDVSFIQANKVPELIEPEFLTVTLKSRYLPFLTALILSKDKSARFSSEYNLVNSLIIELSNF